ncbi:protein SPIRAL1-like 5 [Gastrolobium bilobum]|uniref:protein SPIRAL1-like 5 n=1 Tax=Gastrolobium bilobum TaxID=150636 RepID=UPI002AB0D32D|nr:protein SPIRAL1-like 5 [Gastrolobium bilobum]
MSRGESSGGGQSSLKYLFGSEEKQPSQPPPPPKTVSLPPYGIDIDGGDGDGNGKHPVDGASSTSQVIDRSQGQHLGNILTDRPSTRVKSVPGGHSSLGYLFGDK